MKRVLLALTAFFGVAFLAAAIAIPLYLVPKLKVVPLDLDITTVATTVPKEGEAGDRFPATIFDRCSVSKPRAAQFQAHLTQQRRSVIINPSDSEQATLQSAQTVRIDRVRDLDGDNERDLTMGTGELKCDDALLTSTIDRISVDRKSSVPNNNVNSLQLEAVPEGGSVDDASVKLDPRQGFQYKFGFDVQKREYYYYDLNTRQDAPARFVEEKTIHGVKTYHFVSDVPEVNLSNLPNPAGEAPLGTILDMPAKWWGISGRGVRPNDRVTMQRFAVAKRHAFVEPVTGTIVYGFEEQHQFFKSPDQSPEIPRAIRDFRMDAMNATFQWSDDTAKQQAERATHYVNLLKWGGTIIPIILAVLGVLLLAAFVLLFLRGRKSDDSNGPDDGDYGPGGDGFTPTPTPGPVTTERSDEYAEPDSARTTVIPTTGAPAGGRHSEPEATTTAIPAVDNAASPADDTDTAAFRSPIAPDADPTRPMPDVDRYRRNE